MVNAISIDLEDWFCVSNFRGIINPNDWNKQESRIVANTNRLLELFDKSNVSATFFVLGWIAEQFPELVRKISDHGHEIASHGYSHEMLTTLSPETFEADLRKAINVTQKCTDKKIIGFRAPSFTITNETMWAIGILEKLGFQYDSSIFPVGFHPDYGISKAPLNIHKLSESFYEFPLSVIEVLGKRIPCSGGAYFRLFPYRLTRILLQRINKEGRPFVFYLHPWEIDPGQPRLSLPFTKKIRHYLNLNRTYSRLNCLLHDFKITTIKEVLGL